MSKTMALNVRVNGQLSEFVAHKIGDSGTFDNVSEYVRDLIRNDMARADHEKFERLKAELRAAFAKPDDSYEVLSSDDIINRNRSQ